MPVKVCQLNHFRTSPIITPVIIQYTHASFDSATMKTRKWSPAHLIWLINTTLTFKPI